MHPLEGIEDLLQKFLAHADAVVLTVKIQPHLLPLRLIRPGGFGKMLREPHFYLSFILCIFHRIADDIHQNLPQMERISQQAFLLDAADLDPQRLILLRRLRTDDYRDIMDQVRQ